MPLWNALRIVRGSPRGQGAPELDISIGLHKECVNEWNSVVAHASCGQRPLITLRTDESRVSSPSASHVTCQIQVPWSQLTGPAGWMLRANAGTSVRPCGVMARYAWRTVARARRSWRLADCACKKRSGNGGGLRLLLQFSGLVPERGWCSFRSRVLDDRPPSAERSGWIAQAMTGDSVASHTSDHRSLAASSCTACCALQISTAKLAAHIPEEERALRVKGITPKSVFQIGGSGSVGTASLRGMPLLLRLRQAGFRRVALRCPRTGQAAGGGDVLPTKYRSGTQVQPGGTGCLPAPQTAGESSLCRPRTEGHGEGGAPGEDAFDALVSCMVMTEHRNGFYKLPRPNDPNYMLEGWTWAADAAEACR